MWINNLTNNYYNGKRLQISPSGDGNNDEGGNREVATGKTAKNRKTLHELPFL